LTQLTEPLWLAYPANVHDAGSRQDVICRVLKHQVHSTSNKPWLQCRTLAGRPFDCHRNGFRTIRGVTRNARLGKGKLYNLIAVVFRFYLKRGAIRKIVEVNTVCRSWLAGFITDFVAPHDLKHENLPRPSNHTRQPTLCTSLAKSQVSGRSSLYPETYMQALPFAVSGQGLDVR